MSALIRKSARLGLIAPALVLTACQFSIGGPDYGELESKITDELNTAYEPLSREVSTVDCPRDQPDPEPGDTFICDAEVDNESVRVEVSVEDDEGNVRFSTLDTVFDLELVAESLEGDIEAEVGFPVRVDCGEGLEVVPVGDSFSCSAADPQGVEKTVEVTAEDDGEESWRIID